MEWNLACPRAERLKCLLKAAGFCMLYIPDVIWAVNKHEKKTWKIFPHLKDISTFQYVQTVSLLAHKWSDILIQSLSLWVSSSTQNSRTSVCFPRTSFPRTPAMPGSVSTFLSRRLASMRTVTAASDETELLILHLEALELKVNHEKSHLTLHRLQFWQKTEQPQLWRQSRKCKWPHITYMLIFWWECWQQKPQ